MIPADGKCLSEKGPVGCREGQLLPEAGHHQELGMPAVVARLSQQSRSSGKFVVMRQLREQAVRSVCGSGEGDRVRDSPVVAQKCCGDRATWSSGGQTGRGSCG